MAERGNRLYLDLLKRALINEIGSENELRLNYAWQCASKGEKLDPEVLFNIRGTFPQRYLDYLDSRRRGIILRRTEPDAYGFSDTLVGTKRLEQLEAAITTVLTEEIPGDFIECGVWRGGASIFARGVFAAYGVTDRKVWLADSFAGLPPPVHEIDSDFSKFRSLAIPLNQVKDAFERYGLLDDQVRFLPGWFNQTLKSAPVDSISVLRADGDLFSSTIDILSALYPRVSPGGFVIIDDYWAVPDCRTAIHAYRARHGLSEPIYPIDGAGMYWRKAC